MASPRLFRLIAADVSLACDCVFGVRVLGVVVVCVVFITNSNQTASSQTTSAIESESAIESDNRVAVHRSPIETINQQIAGVWEAHGLSPSAAATESEWCRRLYLDVLGRIPTVDELRAFLKDRSDDKMRSLVQRLLYDEQYTAQYAQNWSTIWTNLLIGRGGGSEDDSLTSRAGLSKYLRDSFGRNQTYDQMVFELVRATGTTVPGSETFNGATNFLIMKLDEGGLQATAKTAQLFLGMQVQCTQCHNHPFNEWKQNQFWELNAFFRQTVALRRFESGTDEIRFAELADQDFAGEGGSPNEAESYYELRNGLLKAAYPVFVDGKALENRSGYVREVHRREELAKHIIASDYLGKAIVNRMWSHFFGYGFTKPVDDMGPHNPPSHPELLDFLATQLRDNSYDLKQLMQWMVLSEPYALSSRTTKSNAADDPQLGETPKFTHFYLRQMRAEELYASLLIATEADEGQANFDERQQTRNEWLRQFTVAFGTDEGDESTTFNGTIPQALMMFNGELIRRATKLDSGGVLSKVIASNMRPAQQIEYLFMAALARKPTKSELQAANQLLVAKASQSAAENSEKRIGGLQRYDRNEARSANGPAEQQTDWKNDNPQHAALQDIWWAVLNSNEFILNH